jgi:hypothetical protein
VITIRSNYVFHEPQVITVRSAVTFLHSVEALSDNAEVQSSVNFITPQSLRC